MLAELYGPQAHYVRQSSYSGVIGVHSVFVSGLVGFLRFLPPSSAWDLGGEWTGYLVINRRYFGDGPMGTCYGWQMTGALLGHAVITALSGLIIYATGSFNPILVLSIAASMARGGCNSHAGAHFRGPHTRLGTVFAS